MTHGFPQFVRLNQVQDVDLETAENFVGFLDGEYALSFQHVMEMRLRNSGKPCESAFGDRATAYPSSKLIEEMLLQFVECHWLVCGLFLRGIGY